MDTYHILPRTIQSRSKFRKYKMDSRVHQSKAGICWEMEFQADKIHIFQQFLFDLFD